MLILDLKPLLFALLVLLIAAAGAGAWLARRRRSGSVWLNALEGAPCGLVLLEGATLGYSNGYARRLLHLPDGITALPAADWTPLLDEDRAAARRDAGGHYRTVTFTSGRTARWWVTAGEGRDLVLLFDITAQQQTEQAARALVNDLSHELRTPIATLLTHIEILGLADVGEDVRRQSLGAARDEAQRMTRLVNAMLELGRLETSAPLPKRPLDVLTLVEEVVLQVTPRAVEQQMQATIEADAPLPLVPGDDDRLRQVLLNLLDNALKYARPGDRVVVSLHRVPNGIACAVCDSGPGIPAEQLPYVTRRFYRAAPASTPGSGLGLALVTEILRRHDSALELESRTEGETGTCARFVLPT